MKIEVVRIISEFSVQVRVGLPKHERRKLMCSCFSFISTSLSLESSI